MFLSLQKQKGIPFSRQIPSYVRKAREDSCSC
jgi:hypothetical protein